SPSDGRTRSISGHQLSDQVPATTTNGCLPSRRMSSAHRSSLLTSSWVDRERANNNASSWSRRRSLQPTRACLKLPSASVLRQAGLRFGSTLEGPPPPSGATPACSGRCLAREIGVSRIGEHRKVQAETGGLGGTPRPRSSHPRG